jgi:uncharacterized lipoprotein
MKKLIFALLGLVLLSGCKTSQKVVEQPKPEPRSQKLEAEKPMIWKQGLYPKLAVGDPIVFLNSVEIIMDGNFSNQTFFLQDGVIYRMDSIKMVTKTVPALTPGILTSMKKASNGQIQEMNVSFSQNDKTYEFNFQLKSDGTFTLNGNAKLFFNGREYKIQVVTKGGECLLLVNFFVQKDVQTVNESAEGQSVSGTKIIK